jgi:hypothetical protein
LLLNKHDGQHPSATLVPLPDYEALWRGYPHPDGQPLSGALALQQAILDRYGDRYPEKRVRVLAVGPAAAATWEEAIVSNPTQKRRITWVTDLCGRGGHGFDPIAAPRNRCHCH